MYYEDEYYGDDGDEDYREECPCCGENYFDCGCTPEAARICDEKFFNAEELEEDEQPDSGFMPGLGIFVDTGDEYPF